MIILWQIITQTAAANVINDNNQDPNNIGQDFMPMLINQRDNGLFISFLTIDLCIISSHQQIDHRKQFLDMHLDILS